MKTDPNIKCEKCGERDMGKMELHHIIPKCIGGTDADGRVWLCRKCQTILHFIMLKWVWNFVHEIDREMCKSYIVKQTKKYVK